MDASVIRAMARWPDVPRVHGWLELDRRGRWLIRGEPVRHPGLIAFIGRNYGCDKRGRWFFQNGPQRVFVRLAYTPWVITHDGEALITHTGSAVGAVASAWIDESANLLLETELGPGLLRDDQLLWIMERIVGEAGQAVTESEIEDETCRLFCQLDGRRLALGRIDSRTVPQRLGFLQEP